MEQSLAYIANLLIQNDFSDSSLFYGKMGIAIFLFHYAKFTSEKTYRSRAVELTYDCIRDQNSQQTIVSYANGLAGVGVGVEYLTQNNYMPFYTNKMLSGFDRMIFYSTVYGTRTDVSLNTGLLGLGRYLLFRVAGICSNDEHIYKLDNKILLIHITDVFERIYPSLNNLAIEEVVRFLYAMDQTNIFPTKVTRLLNLFSSSILSSNKEDLISRHQNNLEALYFKKHNQLKAAIRENTRPEIALGLYEGLAGIGLYLLSKLDKQHESWKQLL